MIAHASSTTASVLGFNPVVSVSKTRNNCERMDVLMFQPQEVLRTGGCVTWTLMRTSPGMARQQL